MCQGHVEIGNRRSLAEEFRVVADGEVVAKQKAAFRFDGRRHQRLDANSHLVALWFIPLVEVWSRNFLRGIVCRNNPMHAIRLDEEVFGRSLNLLRVYAPHIAEVGSWTFGALQSVS